MCRFSRVPFAGRPARFQETMFRCKDTSTRSATTIAGSHSPRTAGIPPWDLIRYNYPGLPTDLQQAAREVNWYLQEYVGCTTVTPDSRNYVFSSSASPGEIWIPNRIAPVTLTPDQIARDRVLATLREPIVSNLNFGVGRLIHPRFAIRMGCESNRRRLHLGSGGLESHRVSRIPLGCQPHRRSRLWRTAEYRTARADHP